MEPAQKDRLAQARGFLAALRGRLQSRVDPANLGKRSKLSFKAISLREVLLYRIVELGEAACDLYESDKLVSAFTLTRSTYETAAMLYWLHKKILDLVELGQYDGLDDFFMRALFGRKDEKTEVEAFNILKAIDALNKKVSKARAAYDALSEWAHPNFFGTFAMFGRYEEETHCLDLGWFNEAVRHREGLPLLLGALKTFDYYYQDIDDLMPRFIAICDDRVDRQ